MKKIVILLALICVTFSAFSQNIFRPVPADILKTRNKAAMLIGETGTADNTWIWRVDATFAFSESYKNKETNQMNTQVVLGVGPAIGYQHLVAKSATDPTLVNNYGVSFGPLFGESVKLVLAGNLFQYFKFGATYTLNVPSTRGPWGFFVGGGITFN
jgi:hypothetical protein